MVSLNFTVGTLWICAVSNGHRWHELKKSTVFTPCKSKNISKLLTCSAFSSSNPHFDILKGFLNTIQRNEHREKKNNTFIWNIFLKCCISSKNYKYLQVKVNISFHVTLYMLQVVWILLFIYLCCHIFLQYRCIHLILKTMDIVTW